VSLASVTQMPRTAAEWNAYYAGAEHPFCTAVCGSLIALATTLPVGNAVDVGCGCGRHARALADMGWRVEAIDYSAVAIEIAGAGGDTDLIDYRVADVRWWHPHTPVQLILVAYPAFGANALNALFARAMGWMTSDGSLIYAGDPLSDSSYDVLAGLFGTVDTVEADPDRGAPALVCVRGAHASDNLSSPVTFGCLDTRARATASSTTSDSESSVRERVS
jgi:SAM-dependent methyltransferase